MRLGQAVKEVVVKRPNPHCIGWARATASLWGMSSRHDLDEPVLISDRVPVRLSYDGRHYTTDRELTLKAEYAGFYSHIAIRFYFEDGSFREAELAGVPAMSAGETVAISPRLSFTKGLTMTFEHVIAILFGLVLVGAAYGFWRLRNG